MSQAYLDALTDSALKAINAVADDQGSTASQRREALLAINQHASVAVTQKEQEMGFMAVERERFYAESEITRHD